MGETGRPVASDILVRWWMEEVMEEGQFKMTNKAAGLEKAGAITLEQRKTYTEAMTNVAQVKTKRVKEGD